MVINNYEINPADSFTGAWASQLSNWARDPSSESPLARKITSKIGYALLIPVGIIETISKSILGVICAAASFLIPGEDGMRFHNMTAAPLFAGTLFSGISTALSIRNLFCDKEPGTFTSEKIVVEAIDGEGNKTELEGTEYHYDEDFFGDFIYASHHRTTECLTAKLRYQFCEVKDIIL
jgi:hypothetical protein